MRKKLKVVMLLFMALIILGTGCSSNADDTFTGDADYKKLSLRLLRIVKFASKHPATVFMYLLTRDWAFVEASRILDARKIASLRSTVSTELDDLEHYLGLPERVVAMNMAKGAQLVANRWRQENPQTSQKVYEFYQHCSEYLYDLAEWNMMNPLYRRLSFLLNGEQGGICLSFGGGIGSEALKLAAQGNRVFYIDVPDSPVWKFAQWRAHQRHVSINFTAVVPKDVLFDCIVAFDVFEHLEKEELVKILGEMTFVLKPGGRLYCHNNFEVSTEDSAPYSMHRDHRQLWASLVSQLHLSRINDNLYMKPV